MDRKTYAWGLQPFKRGWLLSLFFSDSRNAVSLKVRRPLRNWPRQGIMAWAFTSEARLNFLCVARPHNEANALTFLCGHVKASVGMLSWVQWL